MGSFPETYIDPFVLLFPDSEVCEILQELLHDAMFSFMK